MLRRITITALALLLLAAVSGCTPVTGTASAPADVEATATAATDDAAMDEAAADGAGMANPASVFCEENDGKLEIRDEEAGQVGYCVFADGSECEEWAYMRGECAPGEGTQPAISGMPNPASVFCEDQGGKLEIRQDKSGEYGMCVFTDGSECEEWSYFRGECAPGGRRLDANMPNPASANCIDQGGVLEIRKGADGGEYGMCIFADNTECEEWSLLRGVCAAGDNAVTK